MFLRFMSFVSLAFFATVVHAHFPILECESFSEKESEKLRCRASFSDGSLPGKVELKVMSYQEELIQTLITKSDGSVVFDKPKGEFFIVFDAKHETPAEFDYAELE